MCQRVIGWIDGNMIINIDIVFPSTEAEAKNTLVRTEEVAICIFLNHLF